jgi:hypothetical protein
VAPKAESAAVVSGLESEVALPSSGIFSESAVISMRDKYQALLGSAKGPGVTEAERAVSACVEALNESLTMDFSGINADLSKKIAHMGKHALSVFRTALEGAKRGESAPSEELRRQVQLVLDTAEMLKFDLTFLQPKA